MIPLVFPLLLLLLLGAKAVTPNCCTQSTAKLTALPSCSVGSTIFDSNKRLFGKCESCPPGMCRLNDRCFCSFDFATSTSQQSLCKYVFNAIWPFTIGESDPSVRSCNAGPAGETTQDSCCSLTEPLLRARAGGSDDCPRFNTDLSASPKNLANKCDSCPPGTCRLNTACVCPLDFLNSEEQQQACRPSFTRAWPDSVPLEDRHHRACVLERKFDTKALTLDACCAITRERLLLLVGMALDCPLLSDSPFVSLSKVETCAACPIGSCRIGDSCHCPHDFVEGTRLQELCREDFGAVYPDSVGMSDKRCPENPAPVMLKPQPVSKREPDGAANPPPANLSRRGFVSEKASIFGALHSSTTNCTTSSSTTSSSGPASSSESTSSSGSTSSNRSTRLILSSTSNGSATSGGSAGSTASASSSASASSCGSASANGESSNRLSVAEIIGIVTGIISAVGVVVTWFAFCRRRKAMDDGSISSEQPVDILVVDG